MLSEEGAPQRWQHSCTSESAAVVFKAPRGPDGIDLEINKAFCLFVLSLIALYGKSWKLPSLRRVPSLKIRGCEILAVNQQFQGSLVPWKIITKSTVSNESVLLL